MKKVLVLDNDEGTLDVMQEALNYEGFEVKCMEKTSNIFPIIKTYGPDVVVLDYLLDGINGGEICHQIKVNHETAGIPVMIVSAYPNVLKSLGYYGSDDFIAKPFDLDELVWRIRKLADKN